MGRYSSPWSRDTFDDGLVFTTADAGASSNQHRTRWFLSIGTTLPSVIQPRTISATVRHSTRRNRRLSVPSYPHKTLWIFSSPKNSHYHKARSACKSHYISYLYNIRARISTRRYLTIPTAIRSGDLDWPNFSLCRKIRRGEALFYRLGKGACRYTRTQQLRRPQVDPGKDLLHAPGDVPMLKGHDAR